MVAEDDAQAVVGLGAFRPRGDDRAHFGLGGTEFATQEGTLYPLLSRLRRDALVDYEWRESEAGPPRKYYRLTKSGEARLAAFDGYWDQLDHTIARLGR